MQTLRQSDIQKILNTDTRTLSCISTVTHSTTKPCVDVPGSILARVIAALSIVAANFAVHRATASHAQHGDARVMTLPYGKNLGCILAHALMATWPAPAPMHARIRPRRVWKHRASQKGGTCHCYEADPGSYLSPLTINICPANRLSTYTPSTLGVTRTMK